MLKILDNKILRTSPDSIDAVIIDENFLLHASIASQLAIDIWRTGNEFVDSDSVVQYKENRYSLQPMQSHLSRTAKDTKEMP